MAGPSIYYQEILFLRFFFPLQFQINTNNNEKTSTIHTERSTNTIMMWWFVISSISLLLSVLMVLLMETNEFISLVVHFISLLTSFLFVAARKSSALHSIQSNHNKNKNNSQNYNKTKQRNSVSVIISVAQWCSNCSRSFHCSLNTTYRLIHTQNFTYNNSPNEINVHKKRLCFYRCNFAKAHRLTLKIAVVQRSAHKKHISEQSNLIPRERTCLKLQKIHINAATATDDMSTNTLHTFNSSTTRFFRLELFRLSFGQWRESFWLINKIVITSRTKIKTQNFFVSFSDEQSIGEDAHANTLNYLIKTCSTLSEAFCEWMKNKSVHFHFFAFILQIVITAVKKKNSQKRDFVRKKANAFLHIVQNLICVIGFCAYALTLSVCSSIKILSVMTAC